MDGHRHPLEKTYFSITCPQETVFTSLQTVSLLVPLFPHFTHTHTNWRYNILIPHSKWRIHPFPWEPWPWAYKSFWSDPSFNWLWKDLASFGDIKRVQQLRPPHLSKRRLNLTVFPQSGKLIWQNINLLWVLKARPQSRQFLATEWVLIL